jgi:hypothetical protein
MGLTFAFFAPCTCTSVCMNLFHVLCSLKRGVCWFTCHNIAPVGRGVLKDCVFRLPETFICEVGVGKGIDVVMTSFFDSSYAFPHIPADICL